MALSRLGVYIRVPGVDVAKFEQSMQGGGLLGYIDALSGGSISKVGVFSLGESASMWVHGLSRCNFERCWWITCSQDGPPLACSAVIISGLQSHLLMPIATSCFLSWLICFSYACPALSSGWLCSNTPKLLLVLVFLAPCYSAKIAFVLVVFVVMCRHCTHSQKFVESQLPLRTLNF